MYYVSTRGNAPRLGFLDTILTGLANDGGLYVPEYWPEMNPQIIRNMRGCSYQDIALTIMRLYVGDEIAEHALNDITYSAYENFHHPAIAPLIQIDTNHFILELFHGPTLAFKDVAMQWLARVMDLALAQKKQHATIIGATSGDTGGAAIEAFRGRDNMDIFILFPHGRVSDVQRRQMTTVEDTNVYAIAIDGTFDDCQALVKAMFQNRDFRKQTNLSAVNSINWGRILAQIIYYFSAAISLGAPDRPVRFCVPTGNFGDIFAGFAAQKMGLPIEQLTIATNINDILVRAIQQGCYKIRQVIPTASPSMDIQVSSNFERLLFEAYQRNTDIIQAVMKNLQQSRYFKLHESAQKYIHAYFSAERVDEEERANIMRTCLKHASYLLDPHTAIGVCAANKTTLSNTPIITLGTAHPAKFPDAVTRATGKTPSLPHWLKGLMSKPERIHHLDNEQQKIENFILQRTRIY